MNKKDKIEFLFREKEALRAEIIMFNKTNYTSLFSFVAIFGVFAGIYYSESQFKEPAYKQLLLIIISQLEFVLIVFNIFLISNQNIHCGYIFAIERKINSLAKDKLAVWESELVRNYIFKPVSGLYWSVMVLYACFLLFNVFIVLSTYSQLSETLSLGKVSFGRDALVVLQLLELLIIIGLLAWANYDYKIASEKSKKALTQ